MQFCRYGVNGSACTMVPSLTIGYCGCAARVTVVVLWVREMLDVNVKVEEPTQYKFFKKEVNNASFPRNGNVSICTATIERPFVAHAYKARWLIVAHAYKARWLIKRT